MAFRPTAGPDAPKAEDAKAAAQPRWPSSDWHDHLQYHFFFEKIFVQARVFLTPSLEEHSLWIFDHATGKVEELVNCNERMKQSEADHLELTGPRLTIKDGPGGGSVVFAAADGSSEAAGEPAAKRPRSGSLLTVEFSTEHIYSWLPAGQGADAVIHRPDLKLKLSYKGEEHVGRGYSKRYYGMYGPHWGYRFIQSSWLGGKKFLWTADATFRLGDGEAKYNYFKLLDGDSGEIIQADSKDTYQQDCVGYAEIQGKKYSATVAPLGEWLHDFKAGGTNSRMQLRYCKITVVTGDGETFEGYALNERCFGVLG